MPDQVEPPPPAEKDRARWYAEFEALGREAVRIALSRGQGFPSDWKRELAILWLREKEIEREDHESAEYWYAKATFVAAVVAALAAAAGFTLILAGY